MKVLLVSTNCLPPPIPPIGLLYLTGFLKRNGYDVKIVNGATMNDEQISDIPAKGYLPDLIGFSIRNIDSVLMEDEKYLLPDALAIVDRIRKIFPDPPIVVGGAGFSLEPIEIIELVKADFGVVGEGEVPLLQLIQSLENNVEHRNIPGLIYKSASGYKANPPLGSYSETAKNPPLQAIEAVDYQEIYDLCGTASSQTKRGCALKCTYCSYPVVEGRKFRLFSADRVVDELEMFASQGFDHIFFADSIFNAPRRHALEVCEEIIRRGLRVRWSSYASPHGLNDELAQAFAESGCDGIDLGADGLTDKMLLAHGKTFKKKDVYAAAEACKRQGVGFALNVLLGPPGENIETVTETFDAVDEIGADATLIGCGIRVYKRTPIHSQLVSMGKITAEQSMLKPYFYLSEDLPDDLFEIMDNFAQARETVFSMSVIRDIFTPLMSNPEAPLFGDSSLHSDPHRGPIWRFMLELRAAHKARTPNSS